MKPTVVTTFFENQIVPDVIKTAPTKLVKVSFGDKSVNLGNELTPDDVANPPTAVEWETEPNALYTFLFADPDATSRQDPKFRSWRHYVVVNITGSDLNSGKTITSYIGSKPPENTGFHRYAFLVYKQSDLIDPPEVNDFPARRNWNVDKWTAEFHLGDPIAGNFFEARNAADKAAGVGESSHH